MATLTVKNIPEDIYTTLKKTAALHRRSINSEIIVCLERNLRPAMIPAEDILEQAQRLRGRVAGRPFSLKELREARRGGRP